MKKFFTSNSYNNALFNRSFFRRRIHLSRFYWVKNAIIKNGFKFQNILEFGCGDGKLINFLPSGYSNYYGLDCNWEGTLDDAKDKYKNAKNIEFTEINDYKDIVINGKKYDLVICMETLEHIFPELLCIYLMKLAQLTKGYILITVPNEKGIFFLLKRLLKAKLSHDKYTLMETLNIALGKTNNVERNHHKGFDYDHLIYDLKKFFEIVKVEGAPFGRFIPRFLCFNICIIAKPLDLTKKNLKSFLS